MIPGCVNMYTCMCAGIYNIMIHYIYIHVYIYVQMKVYVYIYIGLVKTCFIKALLRLY